jgi:phosphohistidine phosphatase
MDLYIIRHAWAADRSDPRWPEDDSRPLTEEGRRRFAQVAAALAGRDAAPTMIASSPLVRCVETAQLLADAVGKSEVAVIDELRPGGGLDGLLRWTQRQTRSHKAVAWVGHAPDVNRWAAAMIGDGGGLIRFTKGAVASISFDGPPAPGSGELQWLVTAKVLGM